MTTTRKGTKKTARRSSSDISSTTGGVEVGNDSKRPRTDTDTANYASESNNTATAKNKELPTPVELSQELCKIVSDRYSRDESLQALKHLDTWARTYDSDFLKWFDKHGGIVKVLDFLKATMNDANCKGLIRMNCILFAADIIAAVLFRGEDDDNKDIAAKIATTLLDCDGIDTLITANEEYTGGDDIVQLKAMWSVWNAFGILTHTLTTSDLVMNQKTASTIFDAGIDAMSQLKSIGSGDIASEILEHIYCTLILIVFHHCVTKKYLQDKDVLSKCLEVLKRNGLWTFESREDLMQLAINFVYSCCHKNLLDNSSDYEMILPLLVIVLKKFPSNRLIRKAALRMMDLSCSTINDKKIIERSGALEVLSILLATDNVDDEAEKDTVRTLIGKIVA